MLITPVINMSGNCEEAIHYYEEVFSTKADFILHYSDAKPEDWKKPLTDEQKKYVYHAEMKIGNQIGPEKLQKSVKPGDTVTYNLTITNIGTSKTFYTK